MTKALRDFRRAARSAWHLSHDICEVFLPVGVHV